MLFSDFYIKYHTDLTFLYPNTTKNKLICRISLIDCLNQSRYSIFLHKPRENQCTTYYKATRQDIQHIAISNKPFKMNPLNHPKHQCKIRKPRNQILRQIILRRLNSYIRQHVHQHDSDCCISPQSIQCIIPLRALGG